MLATVSALLHKVIPDGYVVSALVLLLFLSLWSMRDSRFHHIAFPTYAILDGCGFALFRDQAGLKHA